MPKLKTDQYALVQHSAAGYKGDSTFAHAVEERRLNTAAELATVQKAGGLVFDSYVAASDAAEAENYPADTIGLVPVAPGTFSFHKIDGLRIYIPKPKP